MAPLPKSRPRRRGFSWTENVRFALVAMRAQKIAEFRERFASPYVAAERGYIDEVILPRHTREKLVQALATLDHKRDKNPPKKHGNIPL